mmetsp:Transcript_6071/g.18308  ORF Transcript_6071/g.18308 Transcript_6071/m.18308 type:complete len:327 (-) Transcript_6071:294-1274(-)
MSPVCGTSHNARCWLCTDTCGLFCASLTISLIAYSQWTVTGAIVGKMESRQAAVHATLFNAVGLLALTSHLRAMLSDPGAVPKNAEPLAGDAQRLKEAIAQGASHRKRTKGWCHRCVSYKPPRAHHCNVTGRCVVKLDHYCPWTNNAIGVRNHKFFLLFIWYTLLLCVYALAVLARLGLSSLRDDETLTVSALVVGMCAVLFGLFTSCMLCDQWTVLSTNIAKIDRLKGEALSVSSEVNEVFGGRSRGLHLHWFLPIAVHFPKSVHDDVMGFKLPATPDQSSEETKNEPDLENPIDDPRDRLLTDEPSVLLQDDENTATSLINRSR